jgi:hypothetical protein
MDLQRRIYRTVATMAAGLLATHAVTFLWRLATRERPPKDPEDLDVPASTAVIFAALLAAATAIAQTLAARRALAVTPRHPAPAEDPQHT